MFNCTEKIIFVYVPNKQTRPVVDVIKLFLEEI